MRKEAFKKFSDETLDRLMWPISISSSYKATSQRTHFSTMTLMKMRKRGPMRTEPCGAPASYCTGRRDDALAADTDGAVGEEGGKPSPNMRTDTIVSGL